MSAPVLSTKDLDQSQSQCQCHEHDDDDGAPFGSGQGVTRAARALAAVLLLVAAGAVVAGFLTKGRLAPAAFVMGAFFIVAGVAVPLGMVREGRLEKEESDNCKRDCRAFRRALGQMNQTALAGLAQANFKQMRAFTVIAQRQARMAYYASLIGAAVSLLVLVCGATVAISLSSTASKIAAGALAVLGSALSSFLAKTFLRAYEMTSRQMSYYYGQPLVHCYLLHAEWLTLMSGERLGPEVEAQLLQKVVEASIQAGANAQNHLLGLQELNQRKPGEKTGRRRHRPARERMTWRDVIPVQPGPAPASGHHSPAGLSSGTGPAAGA
jgi:hypothetical protein